MKKALKLVATFAIVVPIFALLSMRYLWMPKEGYPSWEAVRNYLIRDGEIRIVFPEEVTPKATKSSERVTSIVANEVVTKIGYGWPTIVIVAELPTGKERRYVFHSQKLNNWNRIKFVPVDPTDPDSRWLKIENGIEKPFDGPIVSVKAP